MRIHVESLPLPHSLRRATITRNIPHQARYLSSIYFIRSTQVTHSSEANPWIKMTSAPTISPSYYRYPLSPPPKTRPQRADLEDQEQPAFASTTQENTSTQHQQNRRPKTLPLAWNEKERIKLPHATAHPIPSLPFPFFLCFSFLPAVKVPK